MATVTNSQAHRVEREVRRVHAWDIQGREPQLIQNYITDEGHPCWAVVWNEGPDNWADQFIDTAPAWHDIAIETHNNGTVIAIFPAPDAD
jgi:hypothetical protein